ncbi:MAG: DNRLRE domain-containing protein, partial [Chloroflexota bacterium]
MSPKITFPFNILSILLILTLLDASLPTSGVSASQTLTLKPQADSFVSSTQPTTNFGKLSTLRTDASPLQKIYIRFNVSGLAGRKIKSARLLLHSQTTSSKGLILKPVANNTWGETSLNYKNAPVIGSTPLASVASITAGKWVAF